MSGMQKSTLIYGLVDPRTQQLRYVGKTCATPQRRVLGHMWRARHQPLRQHSMSWLSSLDREGFAPEVFVIEEVPAGGDWIEAEQFWIAYFRSIGADLCNHTAGGEGQTGYKQPKDMVEKRIKRGAQHPNFGKPINPAIKSALDSGRRRFLADPDAVARANEARKSAMRSEKQVDRMRRQNVRLWGDDKYKAAITAKMTVTARLPKTRARVAIQSKSRWLSQRDKIIAAQNAGKGEEWRRKQSAAQQEAWSAPGSKLVVAMARRRRLTADDIVAIQARLAERQEQSRIAADFGVSQSTISHIKSGLKRFA